MAHWGYATTIASFLEKPARIGPVPEREVDMVVTRERAFFPRLEKSM
jgi:hypothetical protein